MQLEPDGAAEHGMRRRSAARQTIGAVRVPESAAVKTSGSDR